ncbi:hypothetical protein MG293_000350 [Ovis ammon polii]|uniref:Alpha/beta hydrolase fold-3 domain-containing protein n=1 Tax=Ovis ammon polii TaxID=230172 RepID=A0AAD4YEH5_OVIAM|nr:hypothetical protein MG293_000350 [Ovis ammon polii]
MEINVGNNVFENYDTFAFFDIDFLSRRTAVILDAVVISTNYRLAPEHHFPSQFEDVYNALKWFLNQDVLDKYSVDPERIGISGESAGGNLAAAVTQQLIDDPDVKIKLKTQSLIYPALQCLDLDLPSYRENSNLGLTKSFVARLWSGYFTTDRSLEKAMFFNQHVPVESSHLFKFVNWSSFLPEKFRKGHFYKSPTYGNSKLAKKYPGFLDVRAAPLLADDNRLRSLPLTYVITCQYDILRDDGIMYVTRLQNAGVRVTHNHIEDGFHGALVYRHAKRHGGFSSFSPNQRSNTHPLHWKCGMLSTGLPVQKVQLSMMQEHVQNHMYNGHLARFWMPEPQFYILSEQRTDIKHDWYIPSRFQKRQNSMHIIIPMTFCQDGQQTDLMQLSYQPNPQILESYGVDPGRIGISGDSAGGNLAAAAAQQLLEDPDIKIKLKVQTLIYPALQNFDFDLPSYRENAHYPVLSKSLMIRFWSEYFTTDRSLKKAMFSNQHIPLESSHLFKFVNWSSLLPEKFKKGHIYKIPTHGSSELAKKYPGILDVKASPLLADDSKLRGLPLTYVITCQYDVLRDDGLMYVTRLQNSGVRVIHNHIEGAFHGTLSFLFTKLLEDPDVKIKLKVQTLTYPALQNFDFDLPSYRENAHYPVLPKLLMVRFWSKYFTTDRSLKKAMLSNQHIPLESSHLFKFVNWSSLLPEKFKKGHIYKTPTHGSSELAKKYPGILDVKASPLLADDSKLCGLPLTYVITCQYDVLRDDGLMYVTRLQNFGVRVIHNHTEVAFHATFSFLFTKVGYRAADQYINWLHENL